MAPVGASSGASSTLAALHRSRGLAAPPPPRAARCLRAAGGPAAPLQRVLVVGAGATGACAALRLRRALGGGVAIEVWEKARGPGGRMSTNRQDLRGHRVRADMGAQYLSLDAADARAAEVAELLVGRGVCSEVSADRLSQTPERRGASGWRHLAGTAGGVSDALKSILEEAGAELKTGRRVASLDAQAGLWRARPFRGDPAQFDAVILAVPGRGTGGDNLSKIRGSWEARLSADQSRELQGAEHDERWSYAFFLPMGAAASCDAFFGPESFEKVVDDDVVHLLCYQSRKTASVSGQGPQGAIGIVAHTTLSWARRNRRSNGRNQELLSEVSDRVGSLLGLRSPLSRAVLASKTITWFQSQVTRSISPSAELGPCMAVDGGAGPLVLAGDYFTESSFGGCLRSGFAAADAVAMALRDGGASSRPRASPVPAAVDARGGGKGRSKLARPGTSKTSAGAG